MANPIVGSDFSFDAKLWLAICNGYTLSAFGDGDVISVKMKEDQFKLKIGTTGEGTWSKTNNNSAEIEFNLMQTSPANDFFSTGMNIDVRSPLGTVIPIFLSDLLGTTRFSCVKARCTKWPDHKTAMEAQTKTWHFETANLIQFHGGNFGPVTT